MQTAERMIMTTGAMTVEGVRAYIRTLRRARGISQAELAERMGLSERAYTEWEAGRTEEIKVGPLMRALLFFGAPADHIQRLVEHNATDDEGRDLAEHWLTGAQHRQIARIAEASSADLDAILQTLRAELEQQPALLEFVRGLIAGWHSRGGGTRSG